MRLVICAALRQHGGLVNGAARAVGLSPGHLRRLVRGDSDLRRLCARLRRANRYPGAGPLPRIDAAAVRALGVMPRAEAARRLGVSKSTVYRALRRGESSDG